MDFSTKKQRFRFEKNRKVSFSFSLLFELSLHQILFFEC